MLDFAIFAVTFLVALVAAIIYLYPSSGKRTTVPGLDPITKEDGNLSDIERAGSLHEFLLDLHKQFGDITSFWMGRELVISIASPELFKQQQTIFDRPPSLCKLFEPLFTNESIQFSNGSDGRSRRQDYDKGFSHDELNSFYDDMNKVASDLTKTLESKVKDEHLSLNQYMFAFAFKIVMTSLMGKGVMNEKEILDFKSNYDHAWSEMEQRLADPNIPDDDSQRGKAFNRVLKHLKDSVTKIMRYRKKHGSKSEEYLLIDRIMDHTENDDTVYADILTYLVGGFHTTGNLLTWAFYFLATHKEVEKKLVKEIKQVLGDDDIDQENSTKLKYTRQVLDETLRCAVVAPWAARFQDFDSELGGHKIPKNTPVIHALGVMLHDEKYWPLPNKFDPDRFNEENIKNRPNLAFSPFGFAGKRICPGNKFAYMEATICLVSLIRKFEFTLVDGQVVQPKYGLVGHPEDDIWVTLSKRK
ncbi:cytochrome P450 20A1 isoform X1 [Patella vulgata]|uniref:cytochrome P450 20A1 isoform X1 n=1 Tax=Patella vulgata TaxID=6465 RepID=UPI0021803292|nr:cytochrome P450 20A1 isoform X1 [Patella vulgata]